MSPFLAVTVALLAVADRPHVAAMPLAAKNIPVETAQILDLLVVAELESAGAYAVVRPADIDAMLGLERLKDAAGCDDVSCATDIAQALGVELLMTGTVGKLGDELVLALTLIDVRAGEVRRRAQVTAKADERFYRDAVKRGVAEVLGRAAPPSPIAAESLSPLTVRFDTVEQEHAFEVRLVTSDGREHGCGKPVDAQSGCTLDGLALGHARLSVVSPPLKPMVANLTAKKDKETVVYTLREGPSLGSITCWTYGGVLLAAGVAVVAVGAAIDSKGMIYGGAPGAVAGGALLYLGFTFDGMVMADTRRLREDGKGSWLPFF